MSDQIHEGAIAAGPAQPENVWDALRLAREARCLSLHQVSAHLKLTVRQLEAIERGDLSVLPGATFARGFVRNYARYLDLDPAIFLAASAEGQKRSSVELPEQMMTPSLGRMPVPGNARFASALPAGLLVILLAVVLGAGWHYGWFESREDLALLEANSAQSEVTVAESEPAASEVVAAASPVLPGAADSSPAESASVPVSATSLPVASVSAPVSAMSMPPALARQSVPQAAPVVLQSAPVANAPAQSRPVQVAQSAPAAPLSSASAAIGGLPRLVLSFDGESWVTVRDANGKVVFARLNQAGAVQEVQGTPPFDLVIGNATQVKLNWKGRAVDLVPLIKGDVARVNLQ